MDNMRKTKLSLSMLFLKLYGDKTYREIKDYHSISIYRKHLLKLVKSINFAIEMNLEYTDNFHRTQLHELIESITEDIKSSKSLEALDQHFIAFETELIFTLIGLMPRTIKSIENRKNYWQLDCHRKIMYIQNSEQKKHVIYSIIHNEKYKGKLPNFEELQEVYHYKCKADPKILINWFRKTYPKIYAEVF